MTSDLLQAMREACQHWNHADMLQHTFEALEKSLEEDNDSCIDCAKSMVEVVCRLILDELDDPLNPLRPQGEAPKFKAWVSAAVRVLKLGDNRDHAFRDLISQHHSMTDHLGALRNVAGPASHGRDGYIQRLSTYHRRAAVLSADAIVAFLHQAYLDAQSRLDRTKLPYERFKDVHAEIDRWADLSLEVDEDRTYILKFQVGDEQFSLSIEPSRLLFHFDRKAYIEALRASRDLQALERAGFEPINSLDDKVEAAE